MRLIITNELVRRRLRFLVEYLQNKKRTNTESSNDKSANLERSRVADARAILARCQQPEHRTCPTKPVLKVSSVSFSPYVFFRVGLDREG